MATNEQPWPDEFPVDGVKVTMGMTLDGVDEAEYTDLRRQNLVDFGDEQPTTPRRNGQE